MADEYRESKTEPATPRRRHEARKRGKVARSPEVGSALVLLATVLLLMLSGDAVWDGFCRLFRAGLGTPPPADITVGTVHAMARWVMLSALAPLAPLFVGLAAVSLLAGYGQVGVFASSEVLAPNLDRLDPAAGMSRLFSARSVMTLFTSSLKVVALLVVGYVTWRSYLPRIIALYEGTPATIASTMSQATLDLCLRAAVLMLCIAAMDYAYQRWQYERDLMMSKEEVKEERKLLEGNPEVEARVRRVQRMLARKRMLADVKRADVVVRNPTHYAVALRYDPKRAPAPVVLAKGANLLAKRILELARKYRVPFVHDPPLAQALYKTVEVGQPIPPKLYRAVARVLVQIYRLRGRKPPTPA